MEGTATSVMATVISAIGDFIDGAVSWMGTILRTITATGNEVLLIFCVCVPLVGLGIGMLSRLIHVRG